MINFYQTLKAIDVYKKVIIDDLLCVQYKCFLESKTFRFWTEVGCLVYCTSGKKIYRSQGQDIEVKKGSVFFMKKGTYAGENFFEEDYCALMLFIPEAYIKNFLSKYDYINIKLENESTAFDQSSFISLDLDTNLETFFFSILNYFANMKAVSKELLEVKFIELLLTVFTQPKYTSLSAYFLSLSDDERVNIRRVMEENFASSLKLNEFAELCNMSLSSFKREFPRIYNCSPGKWLISRKLQLADKLLSNTNLNINEIAFRCGFESASHFIRVFKKQQKTTPAQYRLALVD